MDSPLNARLDYALHDPAMPQSLRTALDGIIAAFDAARAQPRPASEIAHYPVFDDFAALTMFSAQSAANYLGTDEARDVTFFLLDRNGAGCKLIFGDMPTDANAQTWSAFVMASLLGRVRADACFMVARVALRIHPIVPQGGPREAGEPTMIEGAVIRVGTPLHSEAHLYRIVRDEQKSIAGLVADVSFGSPSGYGVIDNMILVDLYTLPERVAEMQRGEAGAFDQHGERQSTKRMM